MNACPARVIWTASLAVSIASRREAFSFEESPSMEKINDLLASYFIPVSIICLKALTTVTRI
jgi:hypothetical protein